MHFLVIFININLGTFADIVVRNEENGKKNVTNSEISFLVMNTQENGFCSGYYCECWRANDWCADQCRKKYEY